MAYMCNGKDYVISQVNGQRITSLKGWSHTSQNDLTEIYIGNLPRHIFEDALMPFLSVHGDVLQLRLMMCYSGLNRGFCYVIYKQQDNLNSIVLSLQNKQIGNSRLYAAKSRNICELVVRNISKFLENQTIIDLITQHTYPQKMHFIIELECKNVIVKYPTHREAALAKRSLIGNVYSFGPDASIRWIS